MGKGSRGGMRSWGGMEGRGNGSAKREEVKCMGLSYLIDSNGFLTPPLELQQE